LATGIIYDLVLGCDDHVLLELSKTMLF